MLAGVSVGLLQRGVTSGCLGATWTIGDEESVRAGHSAVRVLILGDNVAAGYISLDKRICLFW